MRRALQLELQELESWKEKQENIRKRALVRADVHAQILKNEKERKDRETERQDEKTTKKTRAFLRFARRLIRREEEKEAMSL